MYQGQNPFITGAVQQFQMVIGESNRAVSTSQALVSVCDEIIGAAQSGDAHTAVMAAQNARNMAVQVADATRTVNQAAVHRLEIASCMVGRIQSRINEVASALQYARSTALTGGQYAHPNPWQTVAPWQTSSSWQYGAPWQTQQMPLM